MSKKQRIFTEDEKQRIIEDYQNPIFNVLEVRENYHINGIQLKEILDEYGIPNRMPRKKQNPEKQTPPLKNAVRTCKKCGKKTDNAKAKFCCYCGADIRSQRQILVDRIQAFAPNVALLPNDTRDEFISLFNAIKNELEG